MAKSQNLFRKIKSCMSYICYNSTSSFFFMDVFRCFENYLKDIMKNNYSIDFLKTQSNKLISSKGQSEKV